MITADQIKPARELLGWSVMRLSKKARRQPALVERAERGIASLHTLMALQQVLESAGVEFTNGDQPGVQLRKTVS